MVLYFQIQPSGKADKVGQAQVTAIKKQLEREITKAKSFFSENHQNIMNNFDLNVTRLRKKRNSIMSPEALNDLEKFAGKKEKKGVGD
jgi:hypothetical protein